MASLAADLVVGGWLFAVAAGVQAASEEARIEAPGSVAACDCDQKGDAQDSVSRPDPVGAKGPQEVSLHLGSSPVRVSYSPPIQARSAGPDCFGGGDAALGPPISYMRQFAGIDSVDPARASHWLDATGSGIGVFTLNYAGSRFKLEGSAFSGAAAEELRRPRVEMLRLDSKSARLSYKPDHSWLFQVSRGALGTFDQLMPGNEVRRTTVSATYNLPLSEGHWQTTFAWGRNTSKDRLPATGYLLESTWRFNTSHALFGRMERVGSDDLMRENEANQRQWFKMNRITLGYVHDGRANGLSRYDVGAFVARYMVPTVMTPTYGREPTTYMMFVRLKFQ